MVQVKVSVQGVLPATFMKHVETQIKDIKSVATFLGTETTEKMKSIIDDQLGSHRGRRSGKLQKHIKYYISDSPNLFSVGIGSIEELNINAPYWRIINYGGWAAPPGTVVWGHFGSYSDPNPAYAGTGVGKEQFTVGQFPLFRMTIKHPIYAMNYIEKTVNWLAASWNVINVFKNPRLFN